MTMQKLTGKMARYDFTVQHRAGVDNTNAECITRFPLMSEESAPILNWSRGKIPTYQTAMAAGAAAPSREEKDIWGDKEVLQFIQTHQQSKGLSAQERDRVYVDTAASAAICFNSWREEHCEQFPIHPKEYSWHWTPIGEWGISECNGW